MRRCVGLEIPNLRSAALEVKMDNTVKTAVGLLIPFVGTSIGAALVFLLREKMSDVMEKLLLGWASGVMLAASVWSLLLPSIAMAEDRGDVPGVPAAGGFTLGVLFLLALDKLVPHLHLHAEEPEGVKSSMGKTMMLMLAVTLHNIPEGMAVGVLFAGALTPGSGVTMAGAFALAIGIALQNFPEGAIISMPLRAAGKPCGSAFLSGVLSGAVEPVAAFFTILLINLALPALPYLLAFAAGAMIYVIIEELIPEAQDGTHSDLATLGAAAGFVLMMVLDVALG
jgi:ZIP family zinc transporter